MHFIWALESAVFSAKKNSVSALMGNNNRTKRNKRGIKQRKDKLGSALMANNKTKQNKR